MPANAKRFFFFPPPLKEMAERLKIDVLIRDKCTGAETDELREMTPKRFK